MSLFGLAPPDPLMSLVGLPTAYADGMRLMSESPNRPPPIMEPLDQQLTRERALSVATGRKQLILTFVNSVRLDFAVTWVWHVRRLGLTNWLVGATDRPALRKLHSGGVSCFSMRTTLPTGEWDWGSKSFKALGQHKVSSSTKPPAHTCILPARLQPLRPWRSRTQPLSPRRTARS